MAASVQHCASAPAPPATQGPMPSGTNPKLKRIVYSKYRELLGSYNDKANAIIDTLPAYMVHEDRGFKFEPKHCLNNISSKVYASANGQRQCGPQNTGYEAPACVQNAMMTKDKKPFTYTPGGIDLSQIKSERMAKRLQRNAQAEGTTSPTQRPAQPQSPGGTPNAAAQIGAAGMGMPFQVLPPPPPPQPGMAGKNSTTKSSTPAPPPPPPSNKFSTTASTLAPPKNSSGPGSAPGSPNTTRKSPTPQRFEPPPLGFRPEIKIPPNPMANLRKVPPPVEKNTFWKEEYAREHSKSPMAGEHDRSTSPAINENQNVSASNNEDMGFRSSALATMQRQKSPESSGSNDRQATPQQKYIAQPKTSPQNQQEEKSPVLLQKEKVPSPSTTPIQPPASSTPPMQYQQDISQAPKPEFRSVPRPQSPAVSVYTRQSENSPQRATESPFKFAQQQQTQQLGILQRPPAPISPLAQQPQMGSTSIASNNQQGQNQAVPWRTQRGLGQAQPMPQQGQPIYTNVQGHQQHQQQRDRDIISPSLGVFSTQAQQQLQQRPNYDGGKPTSVGTLYIAPLAQPSEPQALNLLRQQMQQQQRCNSPMRQIGSQPQAQQLRWLSSQPGPKEQPEWARPEENGNVMPSSLRLKSPPPPSMQQQHQQDQTPLNQQSLQHQNQQQQQYPYGSSQSQQEYYPSTSTTIQGNGYPISYVSNQGPPSGLRLQINTGVNNNIFSSSPLQAGPKERIIPIQLEQTPTTNPSQFNFNVVGANPSNTTAAGYVLRSPNQFVDQGYNNYPAKQQSQRGAATQQYATPVPQQPQQQFVTATNNVGPIGATKTRIIPISMESGSEGQRGPIQTSPVVIQNDSRTPPIQSKSFRILQKITDTIDDGTSDEQSSKNTTTTNFNDNEPAQLHRPHYAQHMSAQVAKNNDQMRRMQIGQDQDNSSPNANIHAPPTYDQRQYIPPSEQQVPEPKKYTGSAIPSRSFKLLQAMTTAENAGPGQSDL